jgi:hypothetical protein
MDAWALEFGALSPLGLTLRQRARKSLTQQITMNSFRSKDLDWSMDGADP